MEVPIRSGLAAVGGFRGGYGMVTAEQGTVEGVIVLTGVVEPEDAWFVSRCLELGTSSFGDTVDEARDNLVDAVRVHIDGLIETGELLGVLRERNIRIDLPPAPVEVVQRVPLGKLVTIWSQSVPAEAKAGAV